MTCKGRHSVTKTHSLCSRIVSGEDKITGINNSSGWLNGRVHCKFQLASHSLVNRQQSHTNLYTIQSNDR